MATEELTPNSHQYKMQFRCPNCGDVFSKLLQKGVEALGRGGVCPTCGVKDGQPKIGQLNTIRKHSEMDELPGISYNTPRM